MNKSVSYSNQQNSSSQITDPSSQQQASNVLPHNQESAKTKKSNQRLIIGLVLIALGINGILAFQNYQLKKQLEEQNLSPKVTPTKAPPPIPTSTISTPSPTLSVDITANWKEYTNIEYNYQFKYPPNWVLKTRKISEITSPLYVTRQNVESEEVNNYLFLISSWDNPEELSLTAWLQFMKNSNALPLPAEDIKLVANDSVANQPAFRIWNDPISKGKKPGKCVQACPVLDVYFIYKKRAYRAQLNYMREADEESQVIFDQILSTFKFTD